ncbi:hypothetical protein SARC_02180 [Sphaeroforma arctica JP610]|uniref:Uncharacterized protein n=1 Tax=Sphaeroforma arctica JP610 TaxID=667725 RepID=A0A0L0G9T0_9EUKA|nr:hypothetical protein SARC_02180 [Sphaeroforma arctica JP610]KNC85659.1 hypothetical protein SARC_02180 [Sphaeroforma arctica JP610]|eukprot:XP_014159561.1 hypothetical protein SARC_02180 [Sphaeroforma arctica JP610]
MRSFGCVNLFKMGQTVVVQAWAHELRGNTYAFFNERQKTAKELTIVGPRAVILQIASQTGNIHEDPSISLSAYAASYNNSAMLDGDTAVQQVTPIVSGRKKTTSGWIQDEGFLFRARPHAIKKSDWRYKDY